MTNRVGAKGQVVIPKDLRDQFDIRAGDEVTFWREGDHVSLRPVDRGVPLRGRFAGSDLIGELMAERGADREREG